MPLSSVTCPNCQQQLTSNRPIPAAARLRCPSCKTPFVAPEEPETPLVARSPFGPAFFIATTVSVLLGASLITAAVIFASKPTPEVVTTPAEDPAAAKLAAEQKKLDDQKRDLETQKRKLDLAKLLANASAALKAEKHGEAETLYEQALAIDPENNEAKRGYGDVKLALRLVVKTREEDAKRAAEVDRLLADGKKAITEKKYALAIETLESARKVAPTDSKVIEALTEARTALDAEKGATDKQVAFEKHKAAGEAAFKAGQFDVALRELAAALTLKPEDLNVSDMKRQAENKLLGAAGGEKKLAAFKDALARARASETDRRFSDAIASLKIATQLFPDDAEARKLLARVELALKQAQAKNSQLRAQSDEALRLGRIEEARRLAEEAMKNWPEDTAASKLFRNTDTLVENVRTTQTAFLRYVQQGAIAMTNLRYADAVASYTEALRLVPTDLETQRSLLAARNALEKELRVRVEYDRLLRVGLAALQRRSFAEARRAYEAALKLLPDELTAADGLSKAKYGASLDAGIAALRAKKKAEAIQAFEAALGERPGDPVATNGLRQARLLR